jgi:hypothetical protein
MKAPHEPRVDSAEMLSDGVIITFDDGKCAVYSHALLRETLSRAQLVEDSDDTD